MSQMRKIDTDDARQRYLAAFEAFDSQQRQSGKEPTWLRDLRADAIARFAELGFPTLKDEEWRQTDISPITRLSGAIAAGHHLNGSAGSDIEPFLLPGLKCSGLVFINGQYEERLSSPG